MIIFLYGSDSYRRLQKLNSIAAEYQKKHSALTVDHFDLAEDNAWERLENFALGQSLFGESRLAVTHNLAQFDKKAKDFLKKISEDKAVTLIITADEKPPKDFDFLIKKPVIAQEFKALTDAQISEFIKNEAEARGLKLNSRQISDLAQNSSDSWSIVTELQKLALGAEPESRLAAPEFFPLIQKLKSGLPSARLTALAYLLEADDPAKIFNILAAVAGPQLKIKMADYDTAIKSGKLEYQEALTDLVLED